MLTNEMTNRELLELAAKAAGCVYLMNGQLYVEGEGNIDWNPLTDDGDALRLEVDCLLQIRQYKYYVIISRGDVGEFIERYVDHKQDKRSARRRAIVRAAAEIGRQME